MRALFRGFLPALTLATSAALAAAPPASAPAIAPGAARAAGTGPSLARCPQRAVGAAADRERTQALTIPAGFRAIARANVEYIAVSTLTGGTVCVSTSSIENADKFRLTRDDRFFHFQWNAMEGGGYMLIDRSGRGQSLDTGAIPTFSPSRARFASIEISESGFGSLNGFLVMAAEASGMRQLAKLTTIPMLVDWRIDSWAGETCINLSGIRQTDMPQGTEDLNKARRTRYVARGATAGWTLTRSATGCPSGA